MAIPSAKDSPLPIDPVRRDPVIAGLSQLAQGLPGFDQVELLIQSKFKSEAPLLSEISKYLFSIGGKRIRPVMTLLTGGLFGLSIPPQALIDVAAGIELIHMATLLHDDIIDKSPMRRHASSPFAKYGADNTLLAGDFLLTRAFSLCAHLDPYIIDRTEEACVALTEGEILEIPLCKSSHTTESSLTIARKKTAALFKLGAVCGAHIARAGDVAIANMAMFGDAIGTAFQILDDILDVTSDSDLLGKKSGLDIIERKPSLVNVLWIESGSPLAQRLLEEPTSDEEQFAASALHELRGGAVIEKARSIADNLASDAKNHLQKAIDSAPIVNRQIETQFKSLIDYTIQRLS